MLTSVCAYILAKVSISPVNNKINTNPTDRAAQRVFYISSECPFSQHHLIRKVVVASSGSSSAPLIPLAAPFIKKMQDKMSPVFAKG